jgi:hypothetical protein
MRTDSPAHKTHTWPSREEWARVQRTPYADLFDGLGFSRWAGDYAPPGEINAVVTELKELYADEGSKLRTAKLAAGPLIRQPGETKTAHIRRYFAMSETDRSRLFPVHTHEQRRQDINTAIKALRNDTLPAHRSWDGVEAILAPLESRWRAAHAAACEARRKEIQATPIDDAAWERELQHRAACERMFAGRTIGRV